MTGAWVYIEITCIKCANHLAHGHVRSAGNFARVRNRLFKEAKDAGATKNKDGEVTCIKCLTPMKDWPLEWH